MARHPSREFSRPHRESMRSHAADHPRARASALTGHVDYLELAERVGQGVSIDSVPRPHKGKSDRDRDDG